MYRTEIISGGQHCALMELITKTEKFLNKRRSGTFDVVSVQYLVVGFHETWPTAIVTYKYKV